MSKISLFMPDFIPESTIAKNRMKLAMGFIDLGWKVDIIARKIDKKAINFLHSSYHKHINIIDLTNGKGVITTLKLAKYLRSKRPYALISSRDKANVLAIIAKQISLTKTNLAIVEHTNLSTEIANHNNYESRLKPWTKLIKYLYPKADRIIAVSQGVAEDLSAYIGLPMESINTIYNPIIAEGFFEKSREKLEHPWLYEDIPVILGVGRLRPQKDFATLLRAFARLRKKTKVRLMIVGRGPEENDLKTQAKNLGISDDVEFTGYVENPLPYMKSSSVFVLSSRWEGLCNVLVEAMACGTPVVSTDCPSGSREILEDGKWGYLVKVGDDNGMATAISKAMRDQRDQSVERAKFFNYTRSANAYLNLLTNHAPR